MYTNDPLHIELKIDPKKNPVNVSKDHGTAKPYGKYKYFP